MSTRPWKIVIVEDNPDDAAIMEIVLREAGLSFALEVCEDGESAARYFAARKSGAPKPDLVLLDLNLPRKDGRGLLKEIKADPETRDVPVIVLTTAASPTEIAEFDAFRRTRCLIKPYLLKDYASVVTAVRGTLIPR